MRLHQLTMTAFGPFADTVEVDFDQLSAAGLFLLTGATGAGKTSVLDAVCFALYGQVPGDRAGAKHLRSDHADAGRSPQVVLEVSIGERRFRFTRSPAWSRPKMRGHGETKVQAHVVVEEQRAGDWIALTNRLDDAGLLVSELLGMTCGQFTQVAMLPQGRFQAFLRASSAERHAVLQQLFRTDRFERVEKWLVERRTEARRASEAGAADVRGVLHRVEEAGGVALPAELADDLVDAAGCGALATWADEVRGAAAAVRDTTVAGRTTALATEVAAASALTNGRAQDVLIRRARAATSELAALAEQQDEQRARRSRLALHHQAAPVGALAVRSRRSATAAVAAEETCRARLDGAAALLSPDDLRRPDLADALRDAQQAHADARAFLPREQDLRAAEDRCGTLAVEIDRDTEALSAVETLLDLLPASLSAAEHRQQAAASAAAGLAGARGEVGRLEALLAAATRCATVTADLTAARADLLGATEHAQEAREIYLDARESRINGMAAELAGALASGCSCPVCGSAEHPAPARGATGSVGRVEEDQARRAHEDAAFAVQNHQVRVAALEAELGTLTAHLDGHDPEGLPSLLAAARSTRADLESQAALSETAAADAARIGGELTAARSRAEALRVRSAALRTERDERRATVAALHAERAGLLGADAPDLASLVEHRDRAARLLESVLVAWDARAAARTTAEDDAAGLLTAASDAGFSRADDALDALLPPSEVAALVEVVEATEARRLAARSTLEDPEIRAVADAETPDLDALAAAHAEASRSLREVTGAADAATARAARLHELGAGLDVALSAWEPLRARHRLAADLASLVEGRSVDNPLRMRLAAFVLSERLRQVVAAANERLSRMTGERYALEHSEDRGVGELRGGLSLRVRDDWNGVHRDPATLSGGETFVVSLALALGLADTVAHEAGGTDIDTLFIDEGFGSLDPDTLEDVMDTLDSLRDGGRVVGLVSHVPELRSRITTQLEVSKGRTGSTLRPVLVGG